MARVILKEKALAKSHRPRHLFNRDTCPFIGSELFGNMLVSVRATGLGRLERAIQSTTGDITADLSTISRIEPYNAEDAAGAMGLQGLEAYLKDQEVPRLKFRLFRHLDPKADEQLLLAFKELVKSFGLPEPEQLDYAPDVRLYRLKGVIAQHIPGLAGFVGAQSIGPFPRFRLVAQYLPQGAVLNAAFPPPVPGTEYPVVGLIDSGTDPTNTRLQAWVVRRDEEDVPRADQDNNHGSFVAGLIANGRNLNHGDQRFPSVQAKILDVVAMPKHDSPIYEDDLLRVIRRVVAKHKDVRTWSMSLSRVSDVCQDHAFSDFAMALDSIQDRHDVTFVVCAGNYQKTPYRGWPPEDLGEADRLHPPADSLHAVTVGSIAHRDRANARVKAGEPSPFTRRGPGAAYLPKPEVCHYGGNCDDSGDCCQMGVLSFDGGGNLAEAIGTSFSTPLVSSILANIRAGVAEPISRNLAKALLIQSAALSSDPIVAADLHYRGFGVPGEVSDILTCAPWQATLIFEPELPPKQRVFAKVDFPIPKCFRRPDNKIEGEFLMTLVYDPPCSPLSGAEYCRTNVDVSLGTYDPGPDGKPAHSKEIPLQPKDYNTLYEKHVIEHGFKWSPVKVYRRSLQRAEGSRWRLVMDLLYRDDTEERQPQRVALVVTMFHRDRNKPVYNDVVTAMRNVGWVTEDLRIDERLRARRRG